MTQNERLSAYFVAHPRAWIPMPDLGRAIGAWAVHSRVADLRRPLAEGGFGMNIENRKIVSAEGCTISFYRYSPETPCVPVGEPQGADHNNAAPAQESPVLAFARGQGVGQGELL